MADLVEAALERTGAVLSGHFLLSSGAHSDRYCQCARLFEHPTEAAALAAMMATRLRTERIEAEAVVAPAMGGVLWGYELARALGLRSLFAERRPGGPFELRRGYELREGAGVILAEDVVTTGGSIMEVATLVERLGGRVAAFAAVADRSGSGDQKFRPTAPFLALTELRFQVYQADDCPMCARGEPTQTPGSRAAGAQTTTGGGDGAN